MMRYYITSFPNTDRKNTVAIILSCSSAVIFSLKFQTFWTENTYGTRCDVDWILQYVTP